jgi:Protein of unknown function (DUF429)
MRYNVHVTGTRFIGVDLAWREGSADLVANESGVTVIDADGRVLDAAWKRGVEQTIAWVDSAAADGDAVMFVDAPLVVRNETGQRLCEKQVGQRYWRWKVSANTTNTGLRHADRAARAARRRRPAAPAPLPSSHQGAGPSSRHRSSTPRISTGKTSSMRCCAPGPHRCGHATALTAARSSACPPMPPATQQPR